MNLEIHRATALDADAIAALHVAAWRAAYRDTLTVEVLARVTVEERAAQWRAVLDTGRVHKPGGARTWLARGGADRSLLGFAAAGPSRDGDDDACLEIYAIYVIAPKWRTRVGTALFEACSAYARDSDRPRAEMSMWVVSTNERARAFCEAHGMSPDGKALVRSTFGIRLPEVRYRRELRTEIRTRPSKGALKPRGT